MFAERLNNSTQLFVKEAEVNDFVEAGKVLIAPGDKHMKIKKIGNRYKVNIFQGEKVNGHCPSVDVLLSLSQKNTDPMPLALFLPGWAMMVAKGLLSMRRNGARTIGQDEKSCVVYGMPKVAYNIGAVEKQVPLEDIPQTILSMLKK